MAFSVVYPHIWPYSTCKPASLRLWIKINSLYLFDLSKAFDTVDHNILIHKLEYFGIRGVGTCKSWFMDYLTNRSQYVYYKGYASFTELITCGVPQDSILGPLLFYYT